MNFRNISNNEPLNGLSLLPIKKETRILWQKQVVFMLLLLLMTPFTNRTMAQVSVSFGYSVSACQTITFNSYASTGNTYNSSCGYSGVYFCGTYSYICGSHYVCTTTCTFGGCCGGYTAYDYCTGYYYYYLINCGISSEQWTFGDGTTAYGSNPTHYYSSPGTYSVNFQATDGCGYSNNTTQLVNVSGPPNAITNNNAPFPMGTNLPLASSTSGGVWSSTSTGVASISSPGVASGVSA
jgi:hypothetical protein